MYVADVGYTVIDIRVHQFHVSFKWLIFRVDVFPLRDILKELQNNVDVDERSYINVRRGHIWEDACRYLSRKKFDPKAVISVKCADDDGSSEGAIDAGGPRREFLRLLLKAANEHSGIFQGNLNQRVLFPNASGIVKYYEPYLGLVKYMNYSWILVLSNHFGVTSICLRKMIPCERWSLTKKFATEVPNL